MKYLLLLSLGPAGLAAPVAKQQFLGSMAIHIKNGVYEAQAQQLGSYLPGAEGDSTDAKAKRQFLGITWIVPLGAEGETADKTKRRIFVFDILIVTMRYSYTTSVGRHLVANVRYYVAREF
ncbi:hypothetical protein BDV96DRAFT_656105 [Lophiotrema nucula]|uniref:Uncharacterized protein n=1 Tax=Lophiotrema nucula TaxID=690887 RepID=A0A6A5ZU87_9PLEO|nr:hypothetical protein BDV96DRAFT_656105 [Lophiotrema nucula]